MNRCTYDGHKDFHSPRRHRDSDATLVDEPHASPPPRPRSCLKSNNCAKKCNRRNKRVQFDVNDYVQPVPEDSRYRSDDARYDISHINYRAPINYARQPVPGTILCHVPIIIYPPHNKEKKNTMYKRFKNALASITTHPDEALLGCRPGKPTAAYMLQREERLAELAELERKAKDRPRVIMKWSEIQALEEQQASQQQMRSSRRAGPREPAHPAWLAYKQGDKRRNVDNIDAHSRGTAERQRVHTAYPRGTDLLP